MKKMYFAVLIVLLTFCTSCEFSETIYINEDGTGKMSMYLDGSELMPMMKGQMPPEMSEPIDSLISFKEIMSSQKAAIVNLSKTDQEMIKSLEKLNVHVVVDADKDKLNADMYMDFSTINDLQNLFDAFSAIGKLAQTGMPAGSVSLSSTNSDDVMTMDYTFKNNKFKRWLRVVDNKLLDSLRGQLGQAQMILASSSYKLDYHFPRKIKTVSTKDAVVGEDGKSVTVTVNALDFINDPEILNMEVELEK